MILPSEHINHQNISAIRTGSLVLKAKLILERSLYDRAEDMIVNTLVWPSDVRMLLTGLAV